MDNKNRIRKCVSNIESNYCLDSIVDGYKLSNLDITEFISRVKQMINNKSTEDIRSINATASKGVSVISYIDGRLKFSGSSEIDLSKFPKLINLVEMCSDFQEKCNINKLSLNKINKVLKSLSLMDETSDSFKNTLSYRLVRIVIVMILYKNYGDASIICSFILNQLYIKEVKNGLRKSEEFIL